MINIEFFSDSNCLHPLVKNLVLKFEVKKARDSEGTGENQKGRHIKSISLFNY